MLAQLSVTATSSVTTQGRTAAFNPHGKYRIGFAANCAYNIGFDADVTSNDTTTGEQHEDFATSPSTNPARESVIGGPETTPIYIFVVADNYCNWSLIVTQGSRAYPSPAIPSAPQTPR